MGSPTEALVAIDAKLTGKKLHESWDRSWNNSVGHYDYSNGQSSWNNFLIDPSMLASTDPNIDQEKLKAYKKAKEKGYKGTFENFKSLNLGGLGQSALDIFNAWQSNKNGGANTSNYDYNAAPAKNNTGLYVGIGAGVLLLGFGVWYFAFKGK